MICYDEATLEEHYIFPRGFPLSIRSGYLDRSVIMLPTVSANNAIDLVALVMISYTLVYRLSQGETFAIVYCDKSF